LENYLGKQVNRNQHKVLMLMKSKNKRKTRINTILFLYRFETDAKISKQIQEKRSVRENIHSETILNIYPVDKSTLLTGSQDRVRQTYIYLEKF